MPTLYEYYNTGADDAGGVYGANWSSQSFTPAITHTITSVKICAYRIGTTDKTYTFAIYASDANDKPTGAVLASGTALKSAWPGHTSYPPPAENWVEISLGAGALLTATVKYCIVMYSAAADANERLGWYVDTTSPTYAGGAVARSTDSGANWTQVTSQDSMFEEWGEPYAPPGGARSQGFIF